MKTTTAYISILFNSGIHKNLKLDMSNPDSAKKVTRLKNGQVTTFDNLELDVFQVAPGDIITENTFTVYPHHLVLLEIRIVESKEI